MIMAQSLFKLLQQRQPEGAIDVLAPRWSLPVIERMPEVRQGVSINVAHGEFGLGKRHGVARQLQENQYDRAIVLPRSFKAALVPWFAGIPKRTGFRGETRYGLINDMRELDKKRLDQTVKRFLALGLDKDEDPGVPPQPELRVSVENQRAAMDRLKVRGDKPVVVLMPGAEYGPAKCWPLDSYAALARLLTDAGYAVWVLGSGNDDAAGRTIADGSAARNLCGQTSLADVVDLLAFCRHAVSNDSGLMHVAAAVGTRVHAIYGSSTPNYTPPLTANRVIHSLQLECSPCFRRECPLGHLNCLNGITPQTVFAGVQQSPDTP
jgi:lipopolysaccharide heptosyltransferase II